MLFKVLLLGDAAVGKTSSIKAYMDEKLKRDYIATIGVDVTTIKIAIDNNGKSKKNLVTLTVWDLAGQEHFQNIRKQFYLGANAAIFIFDVTIKESFENLDKWIFELKDTISSQIPFFLVGNKIDLSKRMISLEEMHSFIDSRKEFVQIHETSALTGEGIRNLFHSCAELIANIYLKPLSTSQSNTKTISKASKRLMNVISNTLTEEKKTSSMKKVTAKSPQKESITSTKASGKKSSSKKKSTKKKSKTSKKKKVKS